MKKIEFEEGQLVTPAFVQIDDKTYLITEAVYEGDTPLSPFMLKKLQDNIEEGIDEQTPHKYILKLTSAVIAGGTITIPCKYKVRS